LRMQCVMVCQKPPVPEENQYKCLTGHKGGKGVEQLGAWVYLSSLLDKTFQYLKEVLLETYTLKQFF
jgi:hypothetical protein